MEPVLLLNYFNKIVISLYNDLNRWNSQLISSTLSEIEGTGAIRKLMFLLADVTNQEKLNNSTFAERIG